jgi:hypothetical protein
MVAPKKIDYDSLEPDWRSGLKSPEQIASDYTKRTGVKCTRQAIVKWFKAHGVGRDLTAQIHAAESRKNKGFIYVLFVKDSSGKKIYKIGFAKDVEGRINTIQTSLPFTLEIFCAFYSPRAFQIEWELHERFKECCVRGEWFHLNDNDLDFIAKLARLI